MGEIVKITAGDERALRFARLGKWAQQYIGDLERKVAELEARVAVLSEGPALSDTAVDGLGTYPDRELGLGARVKFTLPDGSSVTAHVRGDYLELNAMGPDLRSDGIVVQPGSGNVLRVQTDRYW
jgi:hypothetical protein